MADGLESSIHAKSLTRKSKTYWRLKIEWKVFRL
jgi:hypothetical protein